MNKEIINCQKNTIHRLQQECTEKTNAIIALGERLQAKEQECKELKEQFKLAEPLYQSCNIKDRKIKKYEQTLAEIKEIAEPYKMTIKKICGNCKKYDDCHACCYKDINCYKYISSETNACEEFTYLDEFIPNLLANSILQKISEVLKDE